MRADLRDVATLEVVEAAVQTFQLEEARLMAVRTPSASSRRRSAAAATSPACSVGPLTRFSSIVLVDAPGVGAAPGARRAPGDRPREVGVLRRAPRGRARTTSAGAYRELEEETGVSLGGGLDLFGQFTVFHEHSGTDDDFQLFAMRTDLTDDDIECHEGRQIVFVEPSRARGLDLTAAAAIALPAFLDSTAYAAMRS